MSAANAVSNASAGLSAELREQLDQACGRIAPTWPLDQFIAVNPWWEMTDMPLPEVSARLAALAHAKCLMPRGYFAERWGNGVQAEHLRRSAAELGVEAGIDELLDHIRHEEPDLAHWHNVSDLLDSGRDRQHKMAWRDEVTHQISQFCADYFHHDEQDDGVDGCRLYQSWLEVTRCDPGIEVLMAEPGLTRQFSVLPDEPEHLFSQAVEELGVGADVLADYAHALLLDINGWASWIAYRRWQARLDGRDHAEMQALLAIRLAWELALWRHHAASDREGFRRVEYHWRQQCSRLNATLDAHRQSQALTWIWQRAAELANQDELQRALARPQSPRSDPARAELQAAFCIDVRSEVMRRALEAQDDGIETLGFAGFFGLPLEFTPAGAGLTRPQLPGLLKPAIRVVEGDGDTALCDQRQRAYERRTRWHRLGEAAPATFGLVESTGLAYAFKLLRDSFFPPSCKASHGGMAAVHDWALQRDGQPLGIGEQAELAAGILNAMGLVKGFAPMVLLVGHGSSNRNNPHKAGLDCGACGGQTGEVNVRVLARLLNAPPVREALAGHDIHIPSDTQFLAALHDTTTDEIEVFDVEGVDDRLQKWLDAAGEQARRERAGRLGLDGLGDRALAGATRRRARDWSQVRPEWGLADNAAFIVAPRNRTRHLDLQGRVFLHDYRWQEDAGFKVLELIMTAPMLVTHWINMQYNASVTDNLKYGSGNKLLHNVVDGHIGVFEGNGGDLRIGLSMQSLHDGQRWMHRPLRLSVYIAAPRTAIAEIVERHAVVANLIDNDWLYLYRLGDEKGEIERFHQRRWHSVTADAMAGED